MRLNIILASGLFAAAVVASVMVACSDDTPDCKPGILTLNVELGGTANFADTVEVQSYDPAATFTQDFPHTPGGANYFPIDVMFPGGYPTDKTITFLVRARGGATLLGESVATIHLAPTCSTGLVSIRSGETLDAGAED
jgi:hypothetical protein